MANCQGNTYVEYLVIALVVLIATVSFSGELIAPPQVAQQGAPPVATSTTLIAPAPGSAAGQGTASTSPRTPLWSVLRTSFDQACRTIAGTDNC